MYPSQPTETYLQATIRAEQRAQRNALRGIRMTWQRRNVLSWIASHPGHTVAEIDRAVRTARGGHKWMYALVDRLLADGLVNRVPALSGRRTGIALTALGEAALTREAV